MNLFVKRYTLEHNKPINSQSSDTSSEGALLKMDLGDSCGYSNIHVHPSMGDPSVDEILKTADQEEMHPFLKLSLKYAEQDAQDRKMNHDPLTGAFQIENHFLCNELEVLTEDLLRKIKSNGFTKIKVKVGKDPSKEMWFLKNLAEKSPSQGIKLRLDYNEALDNQSFEGLLAQLNKEQKDLIDFIEDPCEYSSDLWSEWNEKYQVDLACDTYRLPINTNWAGSKVLVLKPARMNVVEFLKNLPNPHEHRFVITHYLDHMVGLLTATAAAMRLKFFLRNGLDVCGLLPSTSINYGDWNILENDGPHVVFPEGSGLGLKEKFESTDWESLI